MSDQATETGQAPPADEDSPSSEPTLTEVNAKVDRLHAAVEHIKDLLTGGARPARTSATADAAEGGIREQVRHALEEIHGSDQAARQADADLDLKVKSAVAAAVPEHRPREYRKVTVLMWGDDRDDK